MRDILADLEALQERSARVGRAVVTSVWGSAPRPEGACMVATADGAVTGSVSGGCVEGATAAAIAEAMRRGTANLVTFGVSDENAWEVGLACGGTIKVLVEPTIRPEITAAARGRGGAVLATVVGGLNPIGAAYLLRDDDLPVGPLAAPGASQDEALGAEALLQGLAPVIEPLARDALRHEASRTVELAAPDGGTITLFLEVFPRRPTLVIFGAAHIAVALVPLAKALGYRTVVADGRQAFLTPDRFPSADELILAWPEEALQQAGLDRATYVCILSHDPKFDEPALEISLRSDAAYIGAIGSRKTQRVRRDRLLAAGFTESDLSRIHGPIGLDLGGRQPAEIALAILAEITMVRYGVTSPTRQP
jgi:xanthine dehydrogenase accessory factor